MSNRLSSLPSSAGDHRKRNYAQHSPPAEWSARYATRSPFSSSPPRSSSPQTPYVARHAYGYAYIRSSPEIAVDVAFRGVGEHIEDPHSAWEERYAKETHFKHPAPAYSRVSRTPEYLTDYSYHHPPTSDFDASEFSEDAERDIREPEDSEHTNRGTPAYSSGALSDSEEEGKEDDSNFFAIGLDGMRRTFFRTSAERGQWKNDPVPFKPASTLLPSRKSAPTQSRVSTPTLVNPSRTISEPAPSTSAPEIQPPTSTRDDDLDDRTTANADAKEGPMLIGIDTTATSTCGGAADREEVESPHTMPSLSSDRESSMDVDVDADDVDLSVDDVMPSSPLPPSSPPLSPVSPSMSMQMSRSSSPFLFGRADEEGLEVVRGSSPLSELSDDEEDAKEGVGAPLTVSGVLDALDGGEDDSRLKTLSTLLSDSIVESSTPTTSLSSPSQMALASTSAPLIADEHEPVDPQSTSNLSAPLAGVGNTPSEKTSSDVAGTETTRDRKDAISSSDEEGAGFGPATSLFESAPGDSAPSGPISSAEKFASPFPSSSAELEQSEASSSFLTSLASSEGKTKQESKKPAALKDKNGVRHSSPASSSKDDDAAIVPCKDAKDKEKRKKDQSPEGPVKKKRKLNKETEGAASSSSSSSSSANALEVKPAAGTKKLQEKEKAKAAGKRKAEEEEDVENHALSDSEVAPRSMKKKRKDDATSNTTTASSASSSSATTKQRTSKQPRRSRNQSHDLSDEENKAPSSSSPSEPLDPTTAALHAQICGLLIETMAMSRASSHPVSSLFKSVMKTQPSLRTEGDRTDKEWMKLFGQVLESGDASRGGSGVFGKVESSGKDDTDRPLEAQWFYVPELDEDQERAALIRAMMPRPAKRSETKKYKQYYWRPLEKISRWDDEDEL